MENNTNYMETGTANYGDVKDNGLVGKQIPSTQIKNNSNYMGIDTAGYESMKVLSMTGKQIERTNDDHISISKKDLRKRYIAIAAAATIASFVVSGLASNINDKLAGSKYLYENKSIVVENTHRTADNSGYWYDTDDIAFSISVSDADKEGLLYAVYTKLDYNRLNHMNEVMESLSSYDVEYAQYTDFEDYVIKKGFVKENGEADIESYKKYMDKYICQLSQLEEVESEIGGKTK